VMVAYPH